MKLTVEQRERFRTEIKDRVLGHVYDEMKDYAADVFPDEYSEVFDALVDEVNLIDLVFVDK